MLDGMTLRPQVCGGKDDKTSDAPGNPSQTGFERLHFLDGVRGWAALSVLLFHATYELFGRAVPDFQTSWPSLLNDGRLAVYIFFVLSGQVLSTVYFTTGNPSSVRNLALRRYVRLTVPVFVASAVAYLLMKAGLMQNQQVVDLLKSSDWLRGMYAQEPDIVELLKFSLYGVYFDYGGHPSYDVMLWTMGAELSGSFLVFSLVLLAGERGKERWAWLTAAGLICWLQFPVLLCFVFGMAVSDTVLRPRTKRISSGRRGDITGLSLAASVAVFSICGRTYYGAHVCAVLAGVFVLAANLSPALRSFFSLRLSAYLGKLSFPLYLTHSVIICSLSCWAIRKLDGAGAPIGAVAAAVIPLTVAASFAAAVLFDPVERFAMRVSRHLSTGSR